MALGTVIASLQRSAVGAVLIALQIAVTLAVLCNALFIIRQRTEHTRSSSGVLNEGSVFIVTNQWVGQAEDLVDRERADLAALRALPQITDAVVSQVHPLGGPLVGFTVTLDPDPAHAAASGTVVMPYFVDEQGLNTLGLRLVAGRNFRPDEIAVRHGWPERARHLGGVIVTQALARRLAPDGKVLGRTLNCFPDGTSVPVIGVVASLATSPQIAGTPYEQFAMLVPYLWADSQVFYIVRAKSANLGVAMAAARAKLYEVSGHRVLLSIQTLPEARYASYRADRALALLMRVICAICLAVTACGIVGLTSYWVSQRRRQIGIRRALGATRGAIARQFQTENLLISSVGAAFGVVLAMAANVSLLQSVALARLPSNYLVVGVGMVLLLGQLAALWPALRASAVPPAEATRTV